MAASRSLNWCWGLARQIQDHEALGGPIIQCHRPFDDAAAVVARGQCALQLGELLISVGAQFDLAVGYLGQGGRRQPDFEFDRRFGRVDAEIGERRMPHVVGHESEQPEARARRRGRADDVADTAIAGSEIDRQYDRQPRARRPRPRVPDISMPSPPSGLSSANRPVRSPTILRNEVTESPGSSAAWTAPFRTGT